MSLEKLKLSKRLHSNMSNLGYYSAKEIQLKSLSRIVGGHSLIGIAPEGAGKTTTYVLGVLSRLKYSDDEAPKVLVLAPNEEKINEIVDRFITISGNKELYIMGLKTSGSMEEEIENLVRGVDIVVATPTRARAVYLKLGLNLNRIQTFIIDDADEIIKQGMQTPVRELAQSCGKVQYLAFSTVEHQKLHNMIDDFMPLATIIEVEELGDTVLDTHDMMLYNVPNFTTKINLLNLLLQDEEVFDKLVVFVNDSYTAQKLKQNLHTDKNLISIFQTDSGNAMLINDIEIFKQTDKSRILIVAYDDLAEDINVNGIPFIFHLEVPTDLEGFVKHNLKTSEVESISITFATDIELPEIKKIEQRIGKKIESIPLPEGLIIYQPASNNKKTQEIDESRGGAFHKKKDSNNKNYNYGAGTKAKMTMRKKKG